MGFNIEDSIVELIDHLQYFIAGVTGDNLSGWAQMEIHKRLRPAGARLESLPEDRRNALIGLLVATGMVKLETGGEFPPKEPTLIVVIGDETSELRISTVRGGERLRLFRERDPNY